MYKQLLVLSIYHTSYCILANPLILNLIPLCEHFLNYLDAVTIVFNVYYLKTMDKECSLTAILTISFFTKTHVLITVVLYCTFDFFALQNLFRGLKKKLSGGVQITGLLFNPPLPYQKPNVSKPFIQNT